MPPFNGELLVITFTVPLKEEEILVEEEASEMETFPLLKLETQVKYL